MRNSFAAKSEIAQAYFPHIGAHAATNKLMDIINSDIVLLAQLQETGYRRLARHFSPAQVQLIFARLGNPL